MHYLLESQSISHIPYTLSLSRSLLCDTPCVPSWLRQLLFSSAICRTWSTDKIDSTRNHPHTLAYTHTYPYPPTSLWQLTHPAYPAHLWSPSSWANFLTKVSNLFECKTVAWLGAYQQLPKWKPKNSFKPLNSFGLDSSLSSPLPFSARPPSSTSTSAPFTAPASVRGRCWQLDLVLSDLSLNINSGVLLPFESHKSLRAQVKT